MSSETEAMWQSLAKMALEEQQMYVAERCFAAMGNVAKSRYLQETNKIAEEASKQMVGWIIARTVTNWLFSGKNNEQRNFFFFSPKMKKKKK